MHDSVVNSPLQQKTAGASSQCVVSCPRPSRLSELKSPALPAASVNAKNEKNTIRPLQLISVERIWNCACEELVSTDVAITALVCCSSTWDARPIVSYCRQAQS